MCTLQFVEEAEEPRRRVPCVACEIKRVYVTVEVLRKFGLLQKHGVVVLPHQTIQSHVPRVAATAHLRCVCVCVGVFLFFLGRQIENARPKDLVLGTRNVY